MIRPITLTSFGEEMIGYPGSNESEDSKLGVCIGVHEICEGFLDIKKISTTHNAIVCRSCHLRIVIPASLQTYGDLRAHLNLTK